MSPHGSESFLDSAYAVPWSFHFCGCILRLRSSNCRAMLQGSWRHLKRIPHRENSAVHVMANNTYRNLHPLPICRSPAKTPLSLESSSSPTFPRPLLHSELLVESQTHGIQPGSVYGALSLSSLIFPCLLFSCTDLILCLTLAS